MANTNQPSLKVGDTFTNKQGLKLKVVDYKNTKNIEVEFEDGLRKTTSKTYINKGLPIHPTHGKVKVGDQFPCKDGDTVEVVEMDGASKVKVKWLSDGAEKWRTTKDVKTGINKHPTRGIPKVGDKVKTNRSGVVEVVKVNSAIDVVVRFEDGIEKSVTANAIRENNILHPHGCTVKVGQEYTATCGWKCVVVDYSGAFNVTVEWEDGTKSKHNAKDVKTGHVKPLTYLSCSGIGYIGYGKYVPRSYTKKKEPWQEFVSEEVYGYWSRMLSRCYNEKELAKHPAYRDCHVDEEWHNFQNFAEWALSKPQMGMRDEDGNIFHLEKDILSRGYKVYSESTCTFMPAAINTFLTEKQAGEGLPRGVNRIRPKTENSREGYIARCTVEGEREYLGFVYDPMEAFNMYKPVKEAYAKRLAEKYKNVLEPHVYEQLLKFEVKPFD